jgi:phage terminase large subunit
MAGKKNEVKDGVGIDLQATRIFFENLNSDKEININKGGGGSSKSHSLRQLMIYKFLTEKEKKFLIVRKTMPSMRNSVILPFYDQLNKFGVLERVKIDKVNMNFFYNGNLIHFQGLDDPEKIKSAEYNYMWLEEATDLLQSDFKTLRLYLRAPSVDGKMNQIYLSFNPIDEFHWIKTTLIDDPSYAHLVKVIHSTYKDNPFLAQSAKDRYEELITQDIHLYKIYALGEWGRLENLIYKNWDMVERDVIPKENTTIVYGIDFGYNAPMAVVKTTIKDMEVWEEELLYKTGMTNSDLIAFLNKNISPPHRLRHFYCDSAEPDRIKELRLAGYNAKLAQKNINDGIDLVKRLKIHIVNDSFNFIKEKRAYSWKTDKTGAVIDTPVDFLNHLMDAERYALYSKFKALGFYNVRWF